MYLSLIDTVNKIVKSYGIGILSDSKFWHVLTDSYSFASEYSLRDVFKSCIAAGYISKLIALRGNTKKTKDEISHIIKSENKIDPGKEQEYAAVLYSIAIAIGSCNKKEYSDFINRNNQSSPPTPKPKPNNNNPKDKDRFNIGIIFSSFIGLLILWGSTMIYETYLSYMRWWISGIALLMAIFQLAFCVFALNIFENAQFKWSKDVERTAVWCYIPIISGYFLNDLIPFFFCSSSIRQKLSEYITTDFKHSTLSNNYSWINSLELGTTIEAPGAFGMFLIIILLFCVFSCGLGLYSSKFSFKKPRFQFRKRPVIIMSTIIVIGYLWIIVSPYQRRRTQEHEYVENQQMLKNDIDSLSKRNSYLVGERKNIQQQLLFKGIGLGISLDTAIGYASSFENDSMENTSTESDNNAVEIVEVNIDGKKPTIDDYYFTVKENEPLPCSILTGNTYGDSYINEPHIQYKSESYEGSTFLDNNKVYYRLVALNNKVIAITVTSNRYSGTWSGDYYTKLISLYTRKYGNPEIHKSFPEKGTYYIPNEKVDNYQWTFNEGIVYLSENGIVYLDKKFITDALTELETLIKIKHEQEIAYEDSVRRAKAHQLQIEKERERNDSIKRRRNHENAINEI